MINFKFPVAFLRAGLCSTTLVVLSITAISTQAQTIKEAPLRAHLAFLADDLLEGRGTGQRGGDLAVRYLETQAAAIGLKPLSGNTYRQSVPLVGVTAQPTSSLQFEVSGKIMKTEFGTQAVYGTGGNQSNIAFNAPVVFVGYGIRSEEERWNDYKNVDVKGKLLIMMVNDPQPTAEEPNRFGGKSLTYYGRWTYKYEQALREGASGVLLIHTTPSASYGWSVPVNSFSHERFHLDGAGNPIEGWLHDDTAKALFSAAGQDLDALRAKAESRDFQPVIINAIAQVDLKTTVRKVEQFNVVGMVPGTDPKLKEEAVIYSAHWDHLGKIAASGTEKADHIWNGAIDNASGAASLIAMAQAAVEHPARRTLIFLWPCAEEQYLLGSAAYVKNPLWPLAKTSADLNLDSMNFVGKTLDIGVAGSEHSSLNQTAAVVAKKMGMHLAPRVPDLSGSFFRADHFNFARAGIPAFNVGSAVFSGDGHFEFEKNDQVSNSVMHNFTKHYHQETDRYDPNWDLSGMVQQAQFTLNLGYAVANAAGMATWKTGDAFSEIKR
ncbi:M28 family peptidase [Undibacterium sp. RTI2.1]|uniref:M28 family peptidase n=1 Tax=unclassified Undibacterium TaxID=2630295 RepID=UPI002AB3B92A|nr:MULTISPECIES: M28 family peptidase [unclassified Undibacterium]MDY7539783.1 M28 family peptidase [Undibacterium sp. 5I1]MEB0029431.1 M28 family peptidase [Undibacterium sp. RTI2.1]MEB0115950.1 M28 family peptidase [Undibacterium sp. RTI2.2]MEB0232039.1 M28 family peptidase [Undibacterium sp. 10I3]MEB0256818.1 M28 family peptidase [Undibacterium sp. 5I1]